MFRSASTSRCYYVSRKTASVFDVRTRRVCVPGWPPVTYPLDISPKRPVSGPLQSKRPGSGPLRFASAQGLGHSQSERGNAQCLGQGSTTHNAKRAPVSGLARMWVQPPSMHRPYVTRMVLRKGWAQKGAAARTRRPVSGPPSKKICATNKCTICAKRNGRRGVLLQGECTTGGGTS